MRSFKAFSISGETIWEKVIDLRIIILNVLKVDVNQPSQSDLQLLQAVKDFFEEVPPSELRKSLVDLYLAFHAEPNAIIPSDKIAKHMYLFIGLLDELEGE